MGTIPTRPKQQLNQNTYNTPISPTLVRLRTMSVANDQADFDVDLVGAFNKIDVDGSGSISKEKMWSHVSGTGGLSVSKKDFDALFLAIDNDKNGDIDFAEYSCFMEKVRIDMIAGKKRRKSCMKVSTQRDSLSSSCEQTKQKKLQQSHPSPLGPWSLLLLSTHNQKSLHGGENLDESLPKIDPESQPTLRFFDVEVREYEVTVSDNPGVRAGVALELSWNYNILERTHLDTFEDKRSEERSKNFKKEKKLTRLERERILREFGVTQKEIQEAAKRAASIRNARKKSISMRQHDKFYEKMERGTAPLKHVFRRKSHAKESATVDLERLHPTLLAMMGLEGGISASTLHPNVGQETTTS